MATVWKARQLSLDRLVAIKVLSPRLASDPADVERFHAECRSAAMLKHPGIVQVYDASVHKGLYCLIMEYVAGESLGNRIRRKKRLTEDEVLFVLEHVAQALGHAWKTAGLIHCDIKPDNILIDADGSVKVTDLGLATTLGNMTALAQTDEIMGTPQYMSPEQIAGDPPLDTRTDIYSMGATVYQMLTGRMLFEGSTDEAVLDLQLKGQVPDVMDLSPAVSSRMAWMAEKMLARKRDDRHGDWQAVTADIERLMRRAYPAPPFPPAGRSVMQRSNRRQKPHNPPPASTAAAMDSAPRSTSETVMRTVLLVIILAGLAASVIYILNPRPPKTTPLPMPAQLRAPAPAPAPAPPPGPTPAAAELERYREMFDFAKGWWDKNPQRFQEAIDQFDRVARETKGSKYALMAMDAARSVKQARETAIEKILGDLKARAGELAGQKLYEEAARVYDHYEGPLSAETRVRRIQAARDLRETGAREQEALQTRDREARLSLATALDESAGILVQGKIPEAAAALAAAAGREELRPLLPELQPVLGLVNKTAAMDEKIADTFGKQIGQDVTVQLLSGPKTLVISEVGNGLVHGDQKVSVGEGVAAATVKIKFSLDDLSPRERSQRMGAETDPDVALLKGCQAAKARNLAEARTCFGRLPGEFGVRLLAAVDRREAELQPAAAPPPDGAKVESPAADVKPVAEGDLIGPEAFRALLCDGNEGLTPGDIEIEQNEREAIFKVTVRSRSLQNLDPLKKLAGSLEELYIPMNQASSYAALLALPRLRRLDLSDSAVTDLNGLRDLKLESLNLNGTRVKELAPLRNVPLKELELANTRVFNFDALRGMNLNRLNLANTQFGDMSSIRDMPLRDLNISGTKIFDFVSIRRYQLTVFNASDTPYKDTSLLADMPLTELYLSNTKVYDLAPLRRLPLKILVLSGTTIRDLLGLRDLKLTTLRIDNCKVKDLTPIASMPLTSLAINGSLVEDLSPLKGMGLDNLDASNTAISDLAPLEGMPLTLLLISNTKVTSVKPLARSPLRELHCEGIRADSLMSLRGTPLEVLYCDIRPNQLPMPIGMLFPHLKDFNGNLWFRRNNNNN